MKRLAFFLLLTSSALYGVEKVVKTKNIGVRYLNVMYAHIHQNPNRFSVSLTTLTCAHPMRLMSLTMEEGKAPLEVFNKEWRLVKAGPYEGYVRDGFLSEKKPDCFQDRYSKFFEAMKLEIADMYYWGRLNDLYDYGHTKVGP